MGFESEPEVHSRDAIDKVNFTFVDQVPHDELLKEQKRPMIEAKAIREDKDSDIRCELRQLVSE